MDLKLRRSLAAWWADTPDRWLLDFLESRGALVWFRRGIAGADAGFAIFLALAICSPAGPQHPVARSLVAVLALLCVLRMVWWLWRPWPTLAQSRWSIGAADVVIALACWLDAAPLFGLASTSAFLLPGAYLTFFHGPKAQSAHIGWVTLTIAALTIRVGVAASGPGGWALAAAMALLCLAVTVGLLPVLQLGFWLVRHNAVDSMLDPLTGLSNRRGLDHRLNHLPASAGEGLMCVFVIDLDHFKTVNDRFGHQTGDRVLRQVAARIQTAIGTDALIARTGGEEFAAVALLEPSAVRLLAERLRHTIADATDPPVTASIGVVITTAHEMPRSDDFAVALHCADTAMYDGKRQGGNTVTIRSCAEYADEIRRLADGPRDDGRVNPISSERQRPA